MKLIDKNINKNSQVTGVYDINSFEGIEELPKLNDLIVMDSKISCNTLKNHNLNKLSFDNCNVDLKGINNIRFLYILKCDIQNIESLKDIPLNGLGIKFKNLNQAKDYFQILNELNISFINGMTKEKYLQGLKMEIIEKTEY